MKKSTAKWIAALGAACIIFLLGSAWYAIHFNDSRLVVPTDFSTFMLQPRDLPMVLSIICFAVYVLFLAGLVIRFALKSKRQVRIANRTRKLNPRLGILGFLGFLGFLGIWTYSINGSVFPFCFFGFFGFFGFFFEGKMSDTLMDERFRENAQRAELKAFRVGYALIMLLLLVVGGAWVPSSLEVSAIVFSSGIALILGLTLFLSEYLLYRYDYADRKELDAED